MKLIIEIPEEELHNFEKTVRAAVVDQTNDFWTNTYIREKIREHWNSAAEALVIESLKDSEVLRKMIAAELENKIRKQLTAAIRNVG